MFSCFVVYIIATKQHHSCVSLLLSVGKKHWMVENAWNNYSEARFKKTFRISRSTFRYILNRIGPFLARETETEDPISPELRLALCLYRLGRGDYLYTIAEMAGIGLSTVCSIVNEVCQVLVNHLWSECASSHMPKTQDDFWTSFGNFLAVGQQ